MKPAVLSITAACGLLMQACTASVMPAHPPVERAQRAALTATASQPVTCKTGADCEEKWERALTWVKKNSTYSIKTMNDTLIQTAGPIEPTTDAAFTVTRAATPQGARLDFHGDCGAGASCVPTTLELAASFNRYVMYGY